jgi:ATP-binding cassette subfamily B protein
MNLVSKIINVLRERTGFRQRAGLLDLVIPLVCKELRAHWLGYATALVFMGIGAASTAAAVYLAGQGTNYAYINRSFRDVALVALAAVATFSIKGIAVYGQAVTVAILSNRVIAETQRRIFDALIHQPVAYFANRHSSEFVARFGYASSAAANVLSLVIYALGRDTMSLAALFAVMVAQQPILSLIGIIVLPPAIISVRTVIRHVRDISRTEFDGSLRIVQTVQETMQGFRLVKILNLEDRMRERINDDVSSIERAANKLARVSNQSSPMMEALGGVAVACVVLYGGYWVLVLNAPPGQFISFMIAFLLAYEPAKRIARLNIDLSNQLVGLQTLSEITSLTPEPDDRCKPNLDVCGGEIEFQNVYFSYRPNDPVLRSTSFRARPGRVTALVGPSGAGKSTIFNLILRLYEVESGLILIDGKNIADVSRNSLRSNVTYVGQDAFLFHGTIRDNIRVGRSGATDTEIVSAARAAHAHEFIASFPNGYDTAVGEHGLQLSSGQRQRVAVARALLRDSPIVLLDEPTASLDSETEHHVQAAIARLFENRTIVVIAHRLQTVTHADRIHVIEKGAIVESGTHEHLLQMGRRYARFYKLQLEPKDHKRDEILDAS